MLERLGELLKATDISDKRLEEAGMYEPQRAGFAEEILGWPGLADGKVSMPYKHFLGNEKGGTVINEAEAGDRRAHAAYSFAALVMLCTVLTLRLGLMRGYWLLSMFTSAILSESI